MDFTSLVREDLSFPLLVLSTIVLILSLIVKQAKLFSSTTIKNLPPSPPQLPIIGNLHQVGDKPHASIANLAKQYGPLISLRLGQELLVVASSREAAMGILKTQDRLLSSRVVPTAFKQSSLLPHSLMWSECNDTWKNLRKLCRTELFQPNALEAQSKIREEKLGKMLDFLRRKQGEVIDVEDLISTTLFNTFSSIVFGKDMLDFSDGDGSRQEVKEALHKSLDYAGRVKDFGSFFPVLERFDLHGINKGMMEQFNIIFGSWKDLIEERRTVVNSSAWSSEQSQCFLDRLLEDGFSNNQINEFVLELLAPGSNTTTSTLVWAMSELLRHKDALSKIEEEMKREIDSHLITRSQLSKLTYLQAFIKENFRLHPPVSLLLPRMAIETCEVMNYTIPKKAKILVNVWAMGRDPGIWDDPLSFKPERFIDSKLDFKGQDFELLPFGSGRRMCPGLPSGAWSIQSILAYLIREFDWALPNGEDPAKLDMDDKFAIAIKREKPLKLIFKQKQVYQKA